MAKGALSAKIPVLLKKLASPSLEKFGSLPGVKNDLKLLQSSLATIQAVLEDTEEQRWTNHLVTDWLFKLTDVANDLDNILDELTTEDLRWRIEIRGQTINKVRNFFTPSNPISFNFKMARKIKKVAGRLDVIAKERSNLNLRKRNLETNKDTGIGGRNQTHSFIQESLIFGREKDKEELVQMLIDRENEEDFSVVPIVGMGGLGKTTLAKLVYNDDRVRDYFDQRMWVFVSEIFDVGEIVRAIIASETEEKCDVTHMDPLQSRIREILHGKKHLLVLDDVWNENREKWSELKKLLAGGARGSKIIVTTRSMNVASIMGTLPTYRLKGLRGASCWRLFKARAFPKGDEGYPNLEVIGKKIVEQCRGVPLVAKVLGGILHCKRSESEWFSVLDELSALNVLWKFNEEQILRTLRLSYDHLPSPLKQCFAFCGIFPIGSRFLKEKLCEYWIAQDFIQPSRENELTEDVSAQYFDELCWRSFFQEVGSDGVFEMHDLIHDLAKVVAEFDFSIDKVDRRKNLLGNALHESFVCRWRSVISLGSERKIIEVPDKIFSLVYLRILDLSFTKIRHVPDSICRLKHLRFLDLSYSSIETLPKSISTLYNLRVLKLLMCFQLTELPGGFSKMVRLRCLDINSPWLIQMPRNIGRLSGLQRLTLFIVGKESGCRIEELQGLDLRGELEIRGLQNVRDRMDAEKAGLKEKQNLSSLKLTWKHEDGLEVVTSTNYEEVIEGLHPHPNIQKLHISNFMGAGFPLWLMDGRLSNLVEIHLSGCERAKILPQLSQFTSVKVVKIEHMPELEWWPGDETRELLGEMLPWVEKLTMSGCPKLRHIPHLPNLVELVLIGCSNKVLQCFVGNCTLLRSIWISGFTDLTTFPEGFFHNKSFLKYLTVMYCPNLKSLPKDLDAHTAIEELIFL